MQLQALRCELATACDRLVAGFIMAEVMAFSDLKELGSEANVKAT